MRITVDAEAEVDLKAEIKQMTEGERDEIREILEMPLNGNANVIDKWIHRIKYKGLDTDLTALEVLEKIETELEY